MSEKPPKPKPELEPIVDEPGMAERFQRALRKALNTPPKPHKPIGRKSKERPASKGRVHTKTSDV